MATCRGIHHIFETNPAIPKNLSSFIDSISTPWRKIKPPNDHHSFTEIFGELHFKENPNNNDNDNDNNDNNNNACSQLEKDEEEKWRNISKFSPYHKRSESSSSSMNSESLQLCTEGLGFESLGNLEDLDMDFQSSVVRERVLDYPKKDEEKVKGKEKKNGQRERGLKFPPPISSIGGGNHVVGKPWVCFQSFREDGRFILKEVRIQSQECLHASREDGRLRLSLVQETEEDEFDSDEQEQEQEEPGEHEQEGEVKEEEQEGEIKE